MFPKSILHTSSPLLVVLLCTFARAHPVTNSDSFTEPYGTYISTGSFEPTSTVPSSYGLSVGAAAAICVSALVGAGLLPVVIVAGIGACLEWRQPEETGGTQENRETHGTDLEYSMVYPKIELSAKERAVYEVDGQDAVPEADGREKAADSGLQVYNGT